MKVSHKPLLVEYLVCFGLILSAMILLYVAKPLLILFPELDYRLDLIFLLIILVPTFFISGIFLFSRIYKRSIEINETTLYVHTFYGTKSFNIQDIQEINKILNLYPRSYYVYARINDKKKFLISIMRKYQIDVSRLNEIINEIIRINPKVQIKDTCFDPREDSQENREYVNKSNPFFK